MCGPEPVLAGLGAEFEQGPQQPLDRGRLVCPVHGWKFDVFSGECELFGAQAATYPVRVIWGKLEIRLDIPRPKQIT